MLRSPLPGICVLFAAAIFGLVASADRRPLLREQIEFAMWYEGERKGLDPVDDVMRAVQRRNAGLGVQLRWFKPIRASAELRRWTTTGATGVPDVIVLRETLLPTYAQFLAPLNELIPERELRHFPESVRRRLSFAGNLYGVPWVLRARALFYRPDVLAKAGALAPRTWEELLAAARRVHHPLEKMYGFGLPGKQEYEAAELLLQMLWAHGADLPPVAEPEALDAEKLGTTLRLYQDLHGVSEPEVFTWDREALEELFVEGRLAMLIADKSFGDYITSAAPDLDYATAALPAGSVPAGYISLDLACILKRTAHRDAAARFIRTLTTREACETLMRFGSVPYRADVADEHRLDAAYAPYTATLKHARGLPLGRWDSAGDFLFEGLFGLLTGRQTAEEAAELIRARFVEGESLAHTAGLSGG